MENKIYQISKMDGSNYFLWKLKVQMLLQREKVWSVIEGTEPDPLTDDWRGKDQCARATIGLTLDDRILITTASCSTAKSLWEYLKSNYEHKGLANRLFLLKKLYSASYTAYNSMEAYLNHIQEIIERLRTIGEEVKEPHLIAILLCGLPATFNPLITALETRDGDDMKLSYVLERLRDEAGRLESQELEPNEHSVAVSSIYQQTKRQIICHSCNKPGHVRRNCPRNSVNYPQREAPSGRHDTYKSYMSLENSEQCSPDAGDEWALSGSTPRQTQTEKHWIIDSGASCHMAPDREIFEDLEILLKPINVKVANGETMVATGRGKVNISIKDDKNQQTGVLSLNQVLLVPDLDLKLLSVISLCDDGFSIVFSDQRCEILQHQDVIGRGNKVGKSYVLSEVETEKGHEEQANVCLHLWHQRLGHRAITSLRQLSTSGKVTGMDISPCKSDDFCSACKLGAMKQSSFKPSTNRTKRPFNTLVTDICGPISPATYGDNKYFLTITDEASNYTQVELLKTKSEAAFHLINFIKKGKNKFHYNPEVLRSDEGGEFMGHTLNQYLMQEGIQHQTSVPYTPQQNGRSERKNLTLFNMVRSMLNSSGLPKGLWGEAVLTAAYLCNRLIPAEQNSTPYEIWHGKLPSLKHIREFGCKSFALTPKPLRQKLDNTSVEGYLVGYGRNSKCYRIWIPGSKQIKNAISVQFHEKIWHDQTQHLKPRSSSELVNIDWEPTVTEDNLNDQPSPLRRSQRSNLGIPAERLTY